VILRGIGVLLVVAGCGGGDVGSAIADLSSPDHDIRLQAGYELLRHGPAAVDPLIDCASSGSDRQRYISAQLLGRIGDRRARTVLKKLAEDRNEHVCRAALVALGNMADSGLVDYLVATLSDDSPPALRAAAAQSLGDSGDTMAVAALVHALKDTASSVRKQAVVALHRLWTPKAEAAVAQVLVEDREEIVRFVAVQALGQHRAVSARDPLRMALRDSSVWVRTEAARSLGLMGDAEAVEDLRLLLEGRLGPDRDAAREALRMIGGTDVEAADTGASAASR